MGFLDHSTNNIIVDAVLTDAGRKALSRNDGSFNIYQFALGDDEVDYDIIKKFGRTVGKEKIEKNTPVLEAVTASSLGMKYKLASVSNEFMTHFPTLSLNNGTTLVTFSRSSNITSKTIPITISSTTGVEVEVDLMDAELRIEINNLFLGITGESPDIVHADNIAVYRYPTTPGGGTESSKASIPLVLKSFSDTTFNTFSIAGGSYIRTFMKVIGINSGLTSQIEVKITS